MADKPDTRTHLLCCFPCGCAISVMTIAEGPTEAKTFVFDGEIVGWPARPATKADPNDIADFYRQGAKTGKLHGCEMEFRTIVGRLPETVNLLKGCGKCPPPKMKTRKTN